MAIKRVYIGAKILYYTGREHSRTSHHGYDSLVSIASDEQLGGKGHEDILRHWPNLR